MGLLLLKPWAHKISLTTSKFLAEASVVIAHLLPSFSKPGKRILVFSIKEMEVANQPAQSASFIKTVNMKSAGVILL